MEDQEQIETVETVENSAAPQDSAPVEQAPAAETVAPVEKPNDVVENKGVQPEKPQYTDLERAQYSFKKQLGKQKAKYERQIAEMQKAWEARFDKLEHPEKYAPKTRADFETDDDFINHLVDDKVQAILAQKLEDYQKQEEEDKKQSEIENQYKTRVTDNVAKLYPDEQSRMEYQQAVDAALKDGLGEVLEQDSDLCQYIMLSPMGPKLMYHLATDINAVDALFAEGVTPIARQFKIREMEAKLAAQPAPAPAAPTAVQTQTPPVKPAVVGQPGKTTGAPPRDIFHDKEAMREFLRR